ncbi:unnamed protein product [Mytilus edulis]|uniref:CCHC-type domain-containing protein n=1 Tax=Mytilus edulis TaxID=6550 RepID=A0A8S3VFU0_MYTED|nr:unnamed protein product [Mytilus edulis]
MFDQMYQDMKRIDETQTSVKGHNYHDERQFDRQPFNVNAPYYGPNGNCRRNNSDRNTNQENIPKCYYCGQPGLLARKCYSLRCSNDDFIYNYYCNLITWGLQFINMSDTAKEGDTERLILSMKENAEFFYSNSTMSKYFTECVNTILQVNFLLSQHTKMRVLEGAFVNTKGGNGKNNEADLVQEHAIRNQKNITGGLSKSS